MTNLEDVEKLKFFFKGFATVEYTRDDDDGDKLLLTRKNGMKLGIVAQALCDRETGNPAALFWNIKCADKKQPSSGVSTASTTAANS